MCGSITYTKNEFIKFHLCTQEGGGGARLFGKKGGRAASCTRSWNNKIPRKKVNNNNELN